jgi:FkbM family methyltransferase
MTAMTFRKIVRKFAARFGILYWLRKIVFLYRGGNWTEIERKFVARIVKPGDLVFDVGANRGQSSECYISLGARVVAFEPQADLHDEIRQVCRKSQHLTIDACGLGNQVEQRKMFITDYDQVASLREDWEGDRIGETIISISTLDEKIKQYGTPRYCKIDVEGWEPQVISGLSKPLEIISFEYHLSDRELKSTSNVLDRLLELGSYYCNIREANGMNFLLPQFIRIEEFSKLFPYGLGVSLKDGYGDIYTTLNPDSIL